MSSQELGVVARFTTNFADVLLDFVVPDVDVKARQKGEKVITILTASTTLSPHVRSPRS